MFLAFTCNEHVPLSPCLLSSTPRFPSIVIADKFGKAQKTCTVSSLLICLVHCSTVIIDAADPPKYEGSLGNWVPCKTVLVISRSIPFHWYLTKAY